MFFSTHMYVNSDIHPPTLLRSNSCTVINLRRSLSSQTLRRMTLICLNNAFVESSEERPSYPSIYEAKEGQRRNGNEGIKVGWRSRLDKS